MEIRSTSGVKSPEHLDGGVAQPLVLLEMAADENELRAELARPPPRHSAADPESLGFVGGGKHDPAADGDRLAAQRRVEQLLDRGIEGVEVRMEDGGHRFHADSSTAVALPGSWSSVGRRREHKENIRGKCQAALDTSEQAHQACIEREIGLRARLDPGKCSMARVDDDVVLGGT